MPGNGTYKLTADFSVVSYGVARIVRDINFTPADPTKPDVALCRIFTDRTDAKKILNALKQEATHD
jgi:hypothetical protein